MSSWTEDPDWAISNICACLFFLISCLTVLYRSFIIVLLTYLIFLIQLFCAFYVVFSNISFSFSYEISKFLVLLYFTLLCIVLGTPFDYVQAFLRKKLIFMIKKAISTSFAITSSPPPSEKSPSKVVPSKFMPEKLSKVCPLKSKYMDILWISYVNKLNIFSVLVKVLVNLLSYTGTNCWLGKQSPILCLIMDKVTLFLCYAWKNERGIM